MDQQNYKEDIMATRKGGLGSSDATMVARIGRSKKLSATDNDRLAQMLGIIERPDFSTYYTRLGDDIEMAILGILEQAFGQGKVISNPKYKSDTLSDTFGFDVMNHIDYEMETEDQITWVENKASRYTTDEVQDKYRDQLVWHMMLLKEKAGACGKKYRLCLSHYQTGVTDHFDSANWTLRDITDAGMEQTTAEIVAGLGVIQKKLENFEYNPPKMLEMNNSRAERLMAMADLKEQIDRLTKNYDTIKEELQNEIINEGVDGADMPGVIHLTLVPESRTLKFDSKAYEKAHPEKTYEAVDPVGTKECYKETVRAAYLNVTIQ